MADVSSVKTRPSKTVEKIYGVTKELFLSDITIARKPVVLKGVDIGEAKDKWCPEYLAKVGGEKPVKIHVCQEGRMDFLNKNFAYK